MKAKTRRFKIIGFLTTGLFSLTPQANASDTTINNNQTTTQTLPGNSTLTVTESGSINISGSNTKAISATGGRNTVRNFGTINNTGNSNAGAIDMRDGRNTVMNLGTISTTGSISADAIFAAGGNSTVYNYGQISTVGNSARGIATTGSNNTVVNYGIIETVNSTGIVSSTGNDNSIANFGSITATGDGSRGIRAIGNSNSIINTGTITVTGSTDDAGVSPDGIYVESGNGNTVTNLGTIISRYGKSVVFTGSGNTLNLGNSSFLAGGINLGNGTRVNIATGANYSKLISFSGTLTEITSNGAIPVFINSATKQLATYDPTFFAASTDALGDMTSTISSLTRESLYSSNKDQPLWARGFGTTASYSGTEATLTRNFIFSGVAIGGEVYKSKDQKIGLLGGYGSTSLNTSGTANQSLSNTSNGGYLGVYGIRSWGSLSFDFALNGGIQSFNQQRYINDNTAIWGNSNADSSYQGWWISPEAGITVNLGNINGWSFLPTARLRYATQWFGSYTESNGGSANATINSQQISIGQTFVGIGTKKSLKTTLGKDTKMVLEGQVGYVYRGTAGTNTVGVTMIGQSLSLPTETSNRNAVTMSAGVSIDLSKTVALKIKGEAGAGSGINYIAGGWAGIDIKF